MKRSWRGEEVTFKGRYTRVEGGRLGFVPHQMPHPPLEMGAQSEGATRRAARLTDGVFFGPQLGWSDVARFGVMFREERAAAGAATAGYVGASRSLIVGATRDAAASAARGYLEQTFTMYRTWRMQEPTMGRAAARLRHEPRRLDDPRLAARLRGDDRAGARPGPRPHRLLDLQPAGGRPRAHRLSADDRRADRGAGERCASCVR